MKRQAVAVTIAAAVSLSGCGLGAGLYNAPLPGGADLGNHPYTVTAKFSDVLDLVPQSGVKVNDVAVGRVTKISLERNGRIADVQVQVNGDVRLPANAVASIQQTSLLGEKYVALAPPLASQSRGSLRNGATIQVSQTSNGVEVEQIFGALSLLLNGGGIGQLHEIARELNTFSRGHEVAIRQFFESVRQVVGQINTNKSSITETLDALATLSATLRSNNTQIARVLQSLAPGIGVLADQRKQLITLLDSLNNLSTVTVRTLRSSKDNIVADLQSLAPILQQLAAAGSSLPQSLQVLATYPFTDGAVQSIKGDYLNAFVQTQFNTPGGTIVTARSAGSTSGTSTTVGSSGSRTANARLASPASLPPPSLLPATSAAAPGLPSTLTLTPSTTSRRAASRAAGSSKSTAASRSAASGQSSSGSASGSPSGSASARTSGATGSPAATTRSPRTGSTKTGGGR